MTITIPTGDLCGVINDVIPFASTDDELPLFNCVFLEWDGQMLHAMATDVPRLAWSQWSPKDEPTQVDHQESLYTKWGGDCPPWKATISLPHAKHLTDTFKVGKKEWYTPLDIALIDGSVQVIRHLDSGYSALIADFPDTAVDYIDIRGLLSKSDVSQPLSGLAFNAKGLADFAKVRPRGPMFLRFTGPAALCHITIGERFVGAIMPWRDIEDLPDDEPAAAPETDGQIPGQEPLL